MAKVQEPPHPQTYNQKFNEIHTPKCHKIPYILNMKQHKRDNPQALMTPQP